MLGFLHLIEINNLLFQKKLSVYPKKILFFLFPQIITNIAVSKINFQTMKNLKIFLICGLMLNSLLALSQQRFTGGLLFGALTSQVDGDSYSGYHKSAFHGGLYVSRGLTPDLNFLVEMTYKPKGSRNPIDEAMEGTDYYKLKLRYIEMPFIIQYFYKKIDFNLGTGFAYLVDGKQEGFIAITGHLGKNQSGFNKFDFIGTVGVGISIGDNWNIMARFTYSLIDAAKEYRAPVESFRYPRQYNNVLSISLYRRIIF